MNKKKLKVKIFEFILILIFDQFKNFKIRLRVNKGELVAQL